MAETGNNEIKDLDMASEAPTDQTPVAVTAAPAPEAPIAGGEPQTAAAEPAEPVVIPAKPFMATPPATPVSTAAATTGSTKSGWRKYVHLVVEAILLLAVIALALQLVSARNDNKTLKSNFSALESSPGVIAQKKAEASQKRADQTVTAVSKLVKLPTNETADVKEVTDADAVKKQFLGVTDIQPGDKMLFYYKNSLFIQYRPSTNKVLLNIPLTVK